MAFLDDFKAAIEAYPANSVTLSITNVDVEVGTPLAINVEEIWKFKVKVENNGDVNMNNVVLHVSGLNDTTISTTGPGGPFLTGWQQFGSLTVGAGGSQKSDYLYFQAPADEQPAGTDLVVAHIYDWDGDLNPILVNNAGQHTAGASDTYADEVFP